MRWRSRLLTAGWIIFGIGSCLFLRHLWFVETPQMGQGAFLPLAHDAFLAIADPDRAEMHYLWNPDHTEELQQAPGVTNVVLEALEPVPFPPVQMVDHIVVDGIAIRPSERDDPVKGPLLARVLQDAAQIEWRLLWQRALTGTAAWAAALAAMLGLTWLLRRKWVQP